VPERQVLDVGVSGLPMADFLLRVENQNKKDPIAGIFDRENDPETAIFQ
jgi:hypothetical protein